jgi:RecB family exonuclease
LFFSQEAVSLGPWSPSKVEAAERCPWQFNAQYIEKLEIPQDKAVDLKDDKLRIGGAVHKYAELTSLGQDKAASAAKAKAENKILAKEEQEFNTHLDAVDTFNTRINAFKEKHGVTKDYRELKMAITADLTPTTFFAKDVFLRGVIDRLLIINDQFAIPIDLKTGNKPTLNYAKLQLATYCLFILTKWPTISMVHPTLYFV